MSFLGRVSRVHWAVTTWWRNVKQRYSTLRYGWVYSHGFLDAPRPETFFVMRHHEASRLSEKLFPSALTEVMTVEDAYKFAEKWHEYKRQF